MVSIFHWQVNRFGLKHLFAFQNDTLIVLMHITTQYQSRQALIPRAIQLNAGANIESPHQSVQITPQVTSIALGQDTTNASSTTIGPLAISALPVPSNNSQLLASKWLSTKDLKQLENEGWCIIDWTIVQPSAY
jgi:hypothetical protein